MSSETFDISQLANVLHQNGDKVLNAQSKLSLNAVFLQKLNKEFDLLIDKVGNNENTFEVVVPAHGNSQLMRDLHFLHDFFQKTIGFKLTNSSSLSLLNYKVDISKFKNIKYLEIKKIPIKEVIGLKKVQSKLESIVCIKCLSFLEQLFSKCGGDECDGTLWEELREAVLCFNQIKIVDMSIALAPFLQVLDLSHNHITDVKAIECLPNLKYINLSFNCLSAIPTFNKNARKKIEILIMKNNYVEDLSGLNGLPHITEFDLSNNWIASWESFNALLVLSALQSLSLNGNPISCYGNYRRRVAGYLHISASFANFTLDNIKLSKKEKAVVGIKLSDKNSYFSKSKSEELLKSNINVESSYSNNNSEDPPNTVRKSGKTRLVVVPNLEDGTYEEILNSSSQLDFMSSSTEHLITKKRIENTRSTYGVDNWLVQGSSVVQDILGLPPLLVSTSTPCDDLCLKAALDSVKNTVTTVAVIETQPDILKEDLDKNVTDSFTTCNDLDNTSNYFSADTSIEKVNANDVKQSTTVSEKISLDLEEEELETEETHLDDDEKIFAVLKETKLINGDVVQNEIYFTITEKELRERDAARGKILTKWCLSSLESCVKLKPNKFHIAFDTVRRDKKDRIYGLDENEANTFYKQIVAILENRSLSDMNQIVYKCESCTSQFSAEIRSGRPDNSTRCPFCHSKFILQFDEVPLPSKEIEKKDSEVNNVKNSDSKATHGRSFSASGFFQSLLNQEENNLPKCNSQSSIGSAASLDEPNYLPTTQNNNVKRSDSDIEILSNPSQSSIEVIEGPNRVLSGSTPRRKRSSEERQDVPTSLVAATSVLQSNLSAALTESSSSGSVTDSICTAYENPGSDSSISKQHQTMKTSKKKSEKKDDEPILQGVLSKTRKMMKKKKPVDPVKYSYNDFTNIDHRIKLLLYTSVFEESSEEFSFGIRAFICPFENQSSFPSCVIVSNKKLYFLKVTNSEHGDDARNFLKKVDSLCFNLNAVKFIYVLTWYQGFAVKIQSFNNKWKQYLILLKNFKRTKNFLEFLSAGHYLSNTVIVKEALEKPCMTVQQLLLSSTFLDDTNIQYFCLFNDCTITNKNSAQDIKNGGLLTNSTDIIIIAGNLNWLFEESNQQPSINHFQKIRNILRVYTNQSRVIFQFFDGAKESDVWSLVMEGHECIEELLKCVKESWEKVFSVSLPLSAL